MQAWVRLQKKCIRSPGATKRARLTGRTLDMCTRPLIFVRCAQIIYAEYAQDQYILFLFICRPHCCSWRQRSATSLPKDMGGGRPVVSTIHAGSLRRFSGRPHNAHTSSPDILSL